MPDGFPADGAGGGRRGRRPRARAGARRPHRRRVRHARPGHGRPTSTRRSPSSATAATSCCTTPSPTSAGSSPRATRSTSRRGARGVTVYLPDGKAPLYPPALSEGAASLLPDGPRPAVVFVVRIGDRRRGHARRRRAGRDPQPGQARLRRRDATTSCRTASPSCPAASWPPRTAAARRVSSSPSRRSSSTPTGRGSSRSGPASRARTTTPGCRWPPTSPSPMRCTPPAPACSG